jgi:uncharacterized protein
MARPKAELLNRLLRLICIETSLGSMEHPFTHMAIITIAFLLAGLVKGVSGLGLPTVGIGLLSLAMLPSQAAALIVVPALITNVWQMISGPGLVCLVRRLWLMQLGVFLGTWAGASLMTGSNAGIAVIGLGIALFVYGIIGLMNVQMPQIPARAEWWLGAITGTATGVVTAATGVFVIPAVPYLQALKFDREVLVKALGLSFTVSTIALAWSLASSGILNPHTAAFSLLALIPALIGMIAGQRLLHIMRPDVFRRWFFGGLLLLGIYLVL